ncbi:MAG: LytTR family DNA-binding domain-containing protein [Bacteroidota bacterium]
MIRCIVIDDEPAARQILETFIKDAPQVTLVASYEHALQAMQKSPDLSFDLLFLDINMPKLNGIDYLKSLSEPPQVILTTAYSEYALEGYELNVVDYLLKPFSFDRFLKAVQKVNISDSNQTETGTISLRSDGKTFLVKPEDIIYLESKGDYVKVVLDDQKLMVNISLKRLLDELDTASLIRCHKSFAINKSCIRYIEGNLVNLGASIMIPMGGVYKDEFLSHL